MMKVDPLSRARPSLRTRKAGGNKLTEDEGPSLGYVFD